MPSTTHEERLLWPLGDPHVTPADVAQSLLKEVGMTAGPGFEQTTENVKNQIVYALSKFPDDALRSSASLVEMKLEVTQGDHVFRDTIMWYPLDTVQMAEVFALQTCEDLGLPEGMAKEMVSQIRAQSQREVQRLKAARQTQGK